MTFCPFCGVRQEVDLRRVHFRDLGHNPSMSCPECCTPLSRIEFGTEPVLQIERCPTCLGLFFNPGEIEALLDEGTSGVVWLDPVQLKQIAADFEGEREIVYRRCPVCSERMSHANFGGHSGVILDYCGSHGLWLDGGKFRRLAEWWRAGGRLIHQRHQEQRAKGLHDGGGIRFRPRVRDTIESPQPIPRAAEATGSPVWQAIDALAGITLDLFD